MDNSEQLAKKSMLIGNFAAKRLFALVLASSLALPQPAAAQNSGELTPEQVQTVAQMRKELRNLIKFPHGDPKEKVADLKEAMEKMNPILVGKNVVFSKQWIKYIGKGKPFSEQQFNLWKERADTVYETLEDFTGSKTLNGEKIYIDTAPSSNFTSNATGGHAHQGFNYICFNTGKISGAIREITIRNSWSTILVHEMGHVFADGQKWEAEPETVTNLLIAYVLEHTPGMKIDGSGTSMISGTQTRMTNLRKAHQNYTSGKIKSFGYDYGSAYDYYMFGLVDKVGWDVYKKAVQSYNDNSYTPPVKYFDLQPIVRARDFFDRLEYFSGKPDVLRTLPDEGKMLDRYFTPRSTIKSYGRHTPNVKPDIKPDAKAETIGTKPATNKTISPELQRPLRSYVNPKIEEQNSVK